MNKKTLASFTRQHDAKDCGVACLRSVIRFYGGDNSLESLREMSGTTLQGTSLLGLHQAAQTLGFNSEAFEAEAIENLSETQFPAILHVLIDERLQHYVVLYGIKNGRYIIGDPAKGIIELSGDGLDEIWQSKVLLQLVPNEKFVVVETQSRRKIEWVKTLLKEDTNLLIIAAILGVIIAVLNLSTAIFSQKLIDDILPSHKTNKLLWGISLLAILLLVKSGLGYIRGFFLTRQARDLNSRMVDKFYDAILWLPKSFFDTRRVGELTARMNDTRNIQSVVSYLVGSVVIDVLVMIASLVFLFKYSLIAGGISLIAFPMFGWLLWKFNKPIIQHQQQVMAAYARTESHYVDSISGISTIKSAGKEGFFSLITKHIYMLFQKTIYDLSILANRYAMWADIFNSILVVLMIGYSSYMVLHKQILVGEMMAIIGISSGLFGAIARLSATNIQLQQAKVAFDRMFEFASLKPEYEKQEEAAKLDFKSINIKNLTFRFAGRPQLLKDISIKVSKGEVVSIQGEVGSGKSILMQILQKFYQPESGQITVKTSQKNYQWDELSTEQWRNIMAVVPQQIKIFNGTLLDNICLGNVQEEYQQVMEFCQKLGFDNYFFSLPQGYLTIIGEEGVNLSGGQQQLVALARAIYQKPQVLFLDEFTSGMDKRTEAFALQVLKNIKDEMDVIFITHRTQTALLADKVYILESGVIKSEEFAMVLN